MRSTEYKRRKQPTRMINLMILNDSVMGHFLPAPVDCTRSLRVGESWFYISDAKATGFQILKSFYFDFPSLTATVAYNLNNAADKLYIIYI